MSGGFGWIREALRTREVIQLPMIFENVYEGMFGEMVR